MDNEELKKRIEAGEIEGDLAPEIESEEKREALETGAPSERPERELKEAAEHLAAAKVLMPEPKAPETPPTRGGDAVQPLPIEEAKRVMKGVLNGNLKIEEIGPWKLQQLANETNETDSPESLQ